MRISDWSSDVCSSDLPFDQILPGDLLGHRVFDLQPGVHFHEPDAVRLQPIARVGDEFDCAGAFVIDRRSEEHTSELQSLMRISYAVFCLKKKKKNTLKRHRT